MSDLTSNETHAPELPVTTSSQIGGTGLGAESSKAGLGRRGLLRNAAWIAAGVVPAAAACSTSNTPTATSAPGAAAPGAPMPENPKPASGESTAHGWAFHDSTGTMSPFTFQRRAIGPNDVRIDIKYCGVCHSDIHFGHADWGTPLYPLVAGHEIAGVVAEVGPSVSRFKPGDQVGVGVVVDSCGHCSECIAGTEQYCLNGRTDSYGTKSSDPGGYTQGGYSTSIVTRDHFVLSLPQEADLAKLAPTLCSGITTYSPMRSAGVRAGWKVGVVGVGGLGHFAIQIAKTLGADVTAFTTSPDKAADAAKFGASAVVVMGDRGPKDQKQLDEQRKSFDFILDTVPYAHDLEPYFTLLKRQRVFWRVGLGKTTTPNEYGQFSVANNGIMIGGSIVGGIRETQDAVDFCVTNKIFPQTQVIHADQINDTWQKVFDKQARYRYVIDASTIKT